MDSLVDVAWLQDNLDDPDLRVLDCTVAFEIGEEGVISFYSGHDDWKKAHIPGSGFADIIDDLSDTTGPHQFTLPSASEFERAMSALGVGAGRKVVVYDSNFTMWATRVWWMLKAFGFDDVAVLDGGFTAWQAGGAPVTDDHSPLPEAKFNANLRPGWFVDAADVEGAIGEPSSACVIDALMPEMYSGAQNPYGRPGHIPGAINIPALGVVDFDTRLFLGEASLRERFAEVLDEPNQPVIAYCGGGIAATADAFLLRRLGKSDVAVYDGSMAQWTSDPARPLVLGDQPN